ncbi:MAG TPA: hypothetical protein ENN49_07985 [Bacteroidales bacterium]|nr:hypothetical protein [Bacteroidales bacterium]
MKRYLSKMVLIAFVVYLLSILLIKLILKGYTDFSGQFLKILVESILAGIIFVTLYFGFLWCSLKGTLGYLDSDSFNEPTYGHKLMDVIETRISDFNSFKDVFLRNYSHVKYSEEKSAVKFLKNPNFIRWKIGGIAYLDTKTGNIKIILIPNSGYSHAADKLLNEEMKKLKVLLIG